MEAWERIGTVVRDVLPGSQRAPRNVQRARGLMPDPPAAQRALIEALDGVSNAVSSASTVREASAVIVEAAKRFTGAEKVAIWLLDEHAEGLVLDESTLVVRGSRDTHAQEWWGRHLPDIIDDVFRSGQPLVDVDREHGAWLLAVPVRAQGQPLGVLVAINDIRHRLLPEHSAFLSILGAFAAVSIANARLAEESRYAIMASERERIAREMHDGISQSLFSISLGMELAKKQVTRDPVQALRTLEQLERQLGTSAGELRRLVYDLRPLKLKELGLVDSIRLWLGEATRGSRMTGRVEVRGPQRTLDPSEEACLYRVAKEAISNAVRHSGGMEVAVEIEYGPAEVVLTVADDGDGPGAPGDRPRLNGTGAGLRNMRERMTAESGSLEVLGQSEGGTLVRAVLPVEGE